MGVAVGRSDDAESLVFINYRGSDGASSAAFLHAQLSDRFGAESVFLDYESLELGCDFVPQLIARVRGCAVLLVVVGDRWLDGEIGNRPIDDPDDWVHTEIVEALEHDVPVVPVLFGGAKMIAERLPADLASLANLQYFEIRNRRQRQDIKGLGDYLARQVPRLRDLPVPGLSPWQAVVAALQDGLNPTGSDVAVTIDVDEGGNFDHVTLTRSVPSPVDRLLTRDPQLFHDMVRAAGLRDNADAAQTVRQWMAAHQASRHTRIDRDTIERAANELGLRESQPRAVLSVATLKPDPMAVRADHTLDWVDRFDGASAYLKRRPLAPWTWGQLQAEIEMLPQHLPVERSEVLVTGSLRQATAFAVGGALRMVTGLDVAVNQRGELWASNERFDTPVAPAWSEHRVSTGDDLAVAIAVAVDPAADIHAFIKQQQLPVARLVTLRPPAGIRDNVIPDAATAAAFAHGLRDAVRDACRQHPRIHVFLAGPMGLALLLGHRWNRMRPTVVYEDLQGPVIYEKAFTVDA